MTLSKTDYMLFLRQPAWLWLKKHDRSKLPLVDAALQALFDEGNAFEEQAVKLFPDAVRIGFKNYSEYLSMPRRTAHVLESGAKTMLQGRLEHGRLTCIFDVLVKVIGNEFDLYEIKSSTCVKPEHEYDLAFQTVVLEGAGLRIRKMKVIHVNKEYARKGDLDIRAITTTTDVTDSVRAKIEETKENIQQAFTTLSLTNPPSMSPRHVRLGPLGEWLSIYKTLYPSTHPHSIYNLTRLNASLVGQLEDLGISMIKDIPETIELNPFQKRQVQITKENKRLVDKHQIAEFMGKVQYPLYFLDYETFSKVIPPFDGIRPYQQVPFQYSLHIIDSPDTNLIKHSEYLHTDLSNPCATLLKKLQNDIGSKGTVFVWYETFEKTRNTEMGEMFPEFRECLEQINDRVVDLMIPFSNGWFMDKDFFGSASIKNVLPVLVSELSYDKLAIKEGATAQRLWMECVLDGKKAEQKNQIMLDLLEYCKLDTLAMVQLFKVLHHL